MGQAQCQFYLQNISCIHLYWTLLFKLVVTVKSIAGLSLLASLSNPKVYFVRKRCEMVDSLLRPITADDSSRVVNSLAEKDCFQEVYSLLKVLTKVEPL